MIADRCAVIYADAIGLVNEHPYHAATVTDLKIDELITQARQRRFQQCAQIHNAPQTKNGLVAHQIFQILPKNAEN
jgi:hypothetical protein